MSNDPATPVHPASSPTSPSAPLAGETDWEGHYVSGDMPWEKGEPSPGLVDFLAGYPGLTRGNVCVPGCGTGHDAREWAKAGFTTTGLDLAPSAIRLCHERTQAAGLEAVFHQLNFLEALPMAPFDWLFEHTLFCAINPRMRDNYVDSVRRWLRPKGNYLAVNYLIPDTDGPPFGTTKAELIARFLPHFELLEAWVPRSYPNRTGLELMLWWRKRE